MLSKKDVSVKGRTMNAGMVQGVLVDVGIPAKLATKAVSVWPEDGSPKGMIQAMRNCGIKQFQINVAIVTLQAIYEVYHVPTSTAVADPEGESNLIGHLDREWAVQGWPTEGDDEQAMMYRDIREIVLQFSAQGHSGGSAPYAIGMLEKLLRFQPISPLTGQDSEWEDTGDSLQNKRCSHVFKDKKTGRVTDSRGRIFRDPTGVTFQSKDSDADVTFPYTPVSVIVDRDPDAHDGVGDAPPDAPPDGKLVLTGTPAIVVTDPPADPPPPEPPPPNPPAPPA